MAPPARCLIVERVSEDVFRIIWWDRDCKRREELETRRTFEARCALLTMPNMGTDLPNLGMDHAP
jgi:hypothetical protein